MHEFGLLKCFLQHVPAGFTQLPSISTTAGCTMMIAAASQLPSALRAGETSGADVGPYKAKLPPKSLLNGKTKLLESRSAQIGESAIKSIEPASLWSGTTSPLRPGSVIWTDEPSFKATEVPYILREGTIYPLTEQWIDPKAQYNGVRYRGAEVTIEFNRKCSLFVCVEVFYNDDSCGYTRTLRYFFDLGVTLNHDRGVLKCLMTFGDPSMPTSLPPMSTIEGCTMAIITIDEMPTDVPFPPPPPPPKADAALAARAAVDAASKAASAIARFERATEEVSVFVASLPYPKATLAGTSPAYWAPGRYMPLEVMAAPWPDELPTALVHTVPPQMGGRFANLYPIAGQGVFRLKSRRDSRDGRRRHESLPPPELLLLTVVHPTALGVAGSAPTSRSRCAPPAIPPCSCA